MFNTTLDPPTTHRFACSIEPESRELHASGSRWRIHGANGTLTAWTWLALNAPKGPEVIKGTAVTLPIQRDEVEHLLVAFQRDNLMPLSKVVGEQMCPLRGVVEQTTALVDGLQIMELRRFVSDALLQPLAREFFWRVPASRGHHHSYPGGLAKHALEVATMLASSRGLPLDDRELGIAFALLHDYGKIQGANRSQRMQVHHEQAGLRLLGPLLAELIAFSPDLGLKMQELLGGPRAPRDTPFPLAIGKVVRALDQLSCEAERRTMDVF